MNAKAELLSRVDPPGDAAEDLLRQSLAAAREQGAVLAELRAAFRLAGLWVNRGRDKEARSLLAPVYTTFNEGLDTPDLLEAGLLLQRLSQGATAQP
ncbi:hypothetical protein [Mesorhizobium sp.]|uniref:hypothetical protein n=1 Tax=Mesorhizobium sp. TaxID=1871066 RepID=UPI000FE50ABC|nr:hypothetical protein [Mesorhizobium sp.]RWB66754.1 MAG: hypothetical protein EOQ49_28095 [Mesorhizobium sp.]